MSTELGYQGAQRASDHADRVTASMSTELWSKCAWVRFLEYLVHLGPGKKFTTEDFREWAWNRSLGDPPDARAFGNITREAARKKLIRFTAGNWVKSKNPQTHGRDVKLWEVC